MFTGMIAKIFLYIPQLTQGQGVVFSPCSVSSPVPSLPSLFPVTKQDDFFAFPVVYRDNDSRTCWFCGSAPGTAIGVAVATGPAVLLPASETFSSLGGY